MESSAVADALKVAAIGLPVMFFVIALFVVLGQVLLKMFPERDKS